MEVLTVEEAAKILKLSPYTVRELLKKQKLPGIKIGSGRLWRIRKEDLVAYLNNTGPS